MAIKAVMKAMHANGIVSTKAERSANLEHGLKKGDVFTKGDKSVKKEFDIKIVKRTAVPSKVAKGRLSHFLVYTGRREKTSGGLTKECIGRNKRGRYVSLRRSAHGHKFYQNVKGWNIAFSSARTQLKCHGFVAINGSTLMGQALYVRMKKIHVNQADTQKTKQAKVEQNESATPGTTTSHAAAVDAGAHVVAEPVASVTTAEPMRLSTKFEAVPTKSE